MGFFDRAISGCEHSDSIRLKNRKQNTVGTIAKRRLSQKFTHAQIQILTKFFSIS